MIKIENEDVYGWQHAIRGMRNPKNSWGESDSLFEESGCLAAEHDCEECDMGLLCDHGTVLGEKDLHLAQTLADAGTDHGKFLRMIVVYADITAPLYWWKEYDTYKVGTVANSCSTMHKIHAKEFELSDFSTEHMHPNTIDVMEVIINHLNISRNAFLVSADNKKYYWWQMIQLLPTSYNQKRTVMLNYAVLKNMYHARKNHKLDEWREFCKWIERLPYSDLITGGKMIDDDKPMSYLGENIKKALKEKQITIRELAEMVNVTEVAMSRYISGHRIPKGPVLVNIAKALGVTADELMKESK